MYGCETWSFNSGRENTDWGMKSQIPSAMTMKIAVFWDGTWHGCAVTCHRIILPSAFMYPNYVGRTLWISRTLLADNMVSHKGKVIDHPRTGHEMPTGGVGGRRHALAALPPGMTRYPLDRRLGEPKGRSGQVWKTSHAPRFDPWTVQPIARSYTNYANPTHGCTYQKAMIFIN